MKTHRRNLTAAIALGLVLAVSSVLMVGAASARPAHAAKRTRITIMVGGINKVIYATATLAKNLGYYEKAFGSLANLNNKVGVFEYDVGGDGSTHG